ADMLKEGVTKFGETPNPDAVASNLFEDKKVYDLTFLEKHLSPNPLANKPLLMKIYHLLNHNQNNNQNTQNNHNNNNQNCNTLTHSTLKSR
ncbi:hypothetical protein A2U01_0073031, partial [Trifolium medium]|nr:hypothetical protein [Trifolium medium]